MKSNIIRTLGNIGDVSAIGPLRDCFKDCLEQQKGNIKLDIVIALAKSGDQSADLSDILHKEIEKNPDSVSLDVVEALWKIEGNRILPQISPYVKNYLSDSQSATKMLKLVSQMEASQNFIPEIVSLLDGRKEELLQMAAEILIQIGAKAIPHIAHELKSDAPARKAMAAQILWKMQKEQSLPLILPVIKQLIEQNEKNLYGGTFGKAKAIKLLVELNNDYTRQMIPKLFEEYLADTPKITMKKVVLGIVPRVKKEALMVIPDIIENIHMICWGGDRDSAIKALKELGEPTIPYLIAALKHKDMFVRKEIPALLGDLKANAAVPALEESLYDKNWIVRWTSAKALAQIGKNSLAVLARGMKSENRHVRHAVLQALNDFDCKPDLLPNIVERLKDEDWFVVYSAIRVLGNMEKDALPAAKEIKVFLQDSNPLLREIALKSILKIQGSSEIPLSMLISFLDDRDKFIRQVSKKLLRDIVSKDISALISIFQSEQSNHSIRKIVFDLAEKNQEVVVPQIISAMKKGQTGKEKPLLEILDSLKSLRPDTVSLIFNSSDIPELPKKSLMLKAIQKIDENNLTAFIPFLNHPDERIREQLLKCIGTVKEKSTQVISALMQMLQDPSWKIKSSAIEALGCVGEKASVAIPKLTQIYQECPENVKHAVIESLGKMGENSAEILGQWLHDEKLHGDKNIKLKEHISKVLYYMGVKASGATSHLIRALKDKNPTIVQFALDSLANISRQKDKTASILQVLKEHLSEKEIKERVLSCILKIANNPESMSAASDIFIEILQKEDKHCKIVVLQHISLYTPKEKKLTDIINKYFEQDPDPEIRLKALSILSKLLKNKEKIEINVDLLIKCMQSDSEYLRCEAACTLAMMEEQAIKAIPEFVKLLKDKSAYIRITTLDILEKRGEKAAPAFSSLLEFISHGNGQDYAYQQAIKIMGNIGEKASPATDILLKILADEEKHPQARAYVAEALGKIAPKSDSIILPLISALADPNSNIKNGALRSLQKVDSTILTNHLPALVESLKNNHDYYIKKGILEALSKIGLKEEVLPIFIEILSEKKYGLQRETIEILGNSYIEDKHFFPLLVCVLQNSDDLSIQLLVQKLFGQLSTKFIPDLVQSLQEQNHSVRKLSTEALIRLMEQTPLPVDKLYGVLEHEDPHVVMDAAYVLSKVSKKNVDKKILPVLIEHLTHEEDSIKIAAIKTLGEMKSRAKKALPQLKNLLNAGYTIREEAVKALRKIEEDKK